MSRIDPKKFQQDQFGKETDADTQKAAEICHLYSTDPKKLIEKLEQNELSVTQFHVARMVIYGLFNFLWKKHPQNRASYRYYLRKMVALGLDCRFTLINGLSTKEELQFIVDIGYDVNTPLPSPGSALVAATNADTEAKYAILCKAGYDINRVDELLGTHVHRIIRDNANLEIFIDAVNTNSRFCLDLSKLDGERNTPLLLALKSKSKKYFDLIIKQFIDRDVQIAINAADKTGKSALHYAYTNGDNDAVKVLLSLGADCNLKDAAGKIPSAYASREIQQNLKNASPEEIKLLIKEKQLDIAERRDQINERLFRNAASLNKVDEIRRLLPHVDVDCAHPTTGMTALMIAAREGNREAVSLFMDIPECNPMKKCLQGRTALNYLCEFIKTIKDDPEKHPQYESFKRTIVSARIIDDHLKQYPNLESKLYSHADIDGNLHFFASEEELLAAVKEISKGEALSAVMVKKM